MRKINLLLIISFLSFSIQAQDIYKSIDYPQNYFRLPLDIAPVIAGSFGELRGNHFHSGLDYKTNQREGYPVYAVADGYISRLRVSATGFGNAVYITHPNGYTSVYGHLKKYNDRITQTVKTYQYRIESFEVDFPLLSVEIPVKKGELIAWSGNSGGSGGPHLHFELRDSQTEETINPQLFGLTIPDRVKPTISGLYLYRMNDEPFSEYTPKQYFQIAGANGVYKLNQSPVINVSGQFGFGIMTNDKNSASANTLGVYSIELELDRKTIYNSVWEKFSFENSRAINSHIDFPALLKTGRRIQKSFVDPGNPLKLYKTLVNNGLLNIADNEIHDVQYVIKDVAGNTSRLSFRIRYNPDAVIKAKYIDATSRFVYNQDNRFESGDIKVFIPQGALYTDLNFNYNSTPKPTGAFSKVHTIHNNLTPLQKSYTLCIKPDSTLTEELQSKAIIVDSRRISHGGIYEDGFVKASARIFGNFFVAVDTVAPRIIPVNISDGKNMQDALKIIFKISDNLSGIRSFEGKIDERWVLMEFDAKSATLWHTFDERTLAGVHNLQLFVTDMKNNSKIYTANFNR
jgi:murein DD-endopeptidase MepM/ murein hydrolase activator NlpD